MHPCRSSYVQLLNEVLVTPHSGDGPTEVVDHVSVMWPACARLVTELWPLQPLNPNPESSWNRYFQDNEIIIQIDHDTRWCTQS